MLKQGVDIAYDGTWGYHPLIISLANTGEVISIVNRPGNRPSHEGAAEQLDLTILLCRQAGFRRIYLRGDTDFTQTTQLDAWDAEGVMFLFGIDAMPNLKALAEDLPASAWSELQRPPRYQARGKPRKRPERIKDQIVRQREFEELDPDPGGGGRGRLSAGGLSADVQVGHRPPDDRGGEGPGATVR